MSWSYSSKSSRKVLFIALALSLSAGSLYFGVEGVSVEAKSKSAGDSASPAATFPANAGSLGPIPDNDCAGDGRSVTFTVAGLSGSPSNVSVTFAGTHTWVGDLDVVLLAPGGAPSHVIFSWTGNTGGTSSGDSSNLAGPYTFNDAAAGNWWAAAASVGDAFPIPSGSYRTSTFTSGAATLMNPVFAGIADPNGTWTLRFNDCASLDTGSISSASLTIDTAAGVPGDAPVDFNGDGKTDYAVIRNVGGGESGQARWFYALNGSGTVTAFDWGLSTDFFVPEDYDGDGKDDIAVWRPGAPDVAAFYIYNSATGTVRVEPFGITGDDPTVVGDYNGDGRADLAVYRDGGAAGAQSTWFYRTTPGGPVNYQPWGVAGDFPAPGDYDGDGKNDFVVQRSNGDGVQASFWIRYATGATSVVNFGLPGDLIVPGDYDGDGKTDIAVVRGVGSQIVWYVLNSSNGTVTQSNFGSTETDFTVQGDYTGDGRTDFAIWRNGVFWVQDSATFAVTTFQLGSPGDYPVANYNTH
jgi:subtilisin-like proprotein convertase family protein